VRDRTLVKMNEEDFDSVIGVHLKGSFNCGHHAAVVMKDAGYGRIINVTSSAGLRGNFGQTNYGAAKAGLMGMTFIWALELGKYGVTVNAIAPGTTATERVVAVRNQEQRDAIGRSTLVGRIGEVSDMVGWILFLACPEAGYLTGQTISVNGGRLMV
jgi:3-oxoacyl-[acyl-carrier protein] reductase